MLPAPARRPSGYRVYSAEAVQVVRFIKQAERFGFDLADVEVSLDRVGIWHDGDQQGPDRHLMGLHPHDLRHTFGFWLAEETGKDSYELERRLGPRSQRHIARYTNPRSTSPQATPRNL